jgi:hypothetical protein
MTASSHNGFPRVPPPASDGAKTFRKSKRKRGRAGVDAPVRLRLEPLEARDLPAGSWTALTNLAPDYIGTMMLLSDGTVMAQDNAPGYWNRWYRLTPNSVGSYANGTWSILAPMNLPRLYFASNVLPDGRVLVLGGEYSGSGGTENWTNTGEIYNPVSNNWTNIANFPQTQFGDDPTQLLSDGRVLAGYRNAGYTYIYDPATNSWTLTGNKLREDPSDAETWVKLPDDSILSYDVWTEGQGGTNHAQRYIPSTGSWVDAGNVPTDLSGGSAFGFALGGAGRLPDGRIWYLGANSHTAFYNPSTNTWGAGPSIPNNGSGQVQGADEAPMAMLPDGKVLLAVDQPLHHGPTNVYEFDPNNNSFTNVTPNISGLSTGGGCYTDRMLMLPNGQVLFTTGGQRLAVYTPAGSPSPSWQGAVDNIRGFGNTLLLSGRQLNGISQGASFGDDAEMDTNYPLVQYHVPGSPYVSYARTAHWSSTGVGNGPENVEFTVPTRGIYELNAVANGIPSPTVLNVQMTGNENLVIRNDPSHTSRVQVVSGSTVLAEEDLLFLGKIIVTCGSNADTLTVSYQYGNPLPTGGLEYAAANAGVYTLNVNDQTTSSNQTFTLGFNSVQRSGSAPITFLTGLINFVNVNGGSGNNTYNVDITGPDHATTINTGSGADTVNILGTTSPLTVTTTTYAGNLNTVNIGNAGSLAGITSSVTVSNRVTHDHLVIDDSADPFNRAAHIDNHSVTGLSPGSINWTATVSVDTLSINGGTGNNTYSVNSPDAYLGTTLNTGSGANTVNVLADTGGPLTVTTTSYAGNDDTVNIGNAGSLAGITSSVTVNNTPSFDHLVIDDSADSSNRAVNINPLSVTGLSSGSINWTSTSLDTLTVNGGTRNSTYTVNAPAVSLGTTVNTGLGGNVVNVRSSVAPVTINTGSGDSVTTTSSSNTLDPIGAVTVNDPTGTTALTVDDTGYGGNDSYLITNSAITIGRSSNFSVTYSGIGSLSLNSGPGSDVFNIDSTATVTTVNAGAGGNIFRVSPFTQYLAATLLGPSLTLNGGGRDILEFFDTNDPNVEGFNFDAVPQSLILDSTGTDVTDFFGMGGGVYVETNGFSNESDASGTVIFDPSGGPPSGSGGGQSANELLRQLVVDSVYAAVSDTAGKPAISVTDRSAHMVLLARGAEAVPEQADLIDKVFSM